MRRIQVTFITFTNEINKLNSKEINTHHQHTHYKYNFIYVQSHQYQSQVLRSLSAFNDRYKAGFIVTVNVGEANMRILERSEGDHNIAKLYARFITLDICLCHFWKGHISEGIT